MGERDARQDAARRLGRLEVATSLCSWPPMTVHTSTGVDIVGWRNEGLVIAGRPD